MENKIFKRNTNYYSQKIGDEIVLVAVSDNIAEMDKVYSFNETGAFIWEQLDGNTTVKELRDKICSEFDIDKQTAYNSLVKFLKEIDRFIEEA